MLHALTYPPYPPTHYFPSISPTDWHAAQVTHGEGGMRGKVATRQGNATGQRNGGDVVRATRDDGVTRRGQRETEGWEIREKGMVST